MSINSKMTALADEIRELSGTTTPKNLEAMTSDIDAANTEIAEQAELLSQIATALEGKASNSGGVVLPTLSNPASASDILSGKEAINGSGNKITGTIATKTSSNLTASGATVTVPTGYYASNASKSVTTATQATPTVSIDANGKITASATQTAGYVTAGTKTGTKQMTTKAATTITPGTSSQTAVAKNVYTTGAITVAAIPSNYEDVATETNAYTTKLASLQTAITALEEELQGKASGGTSGGMEYEIVNLAEETTSIPFTLKRVTSTFGMMTTSGQGGMATKNAAHYNLSGMSGTFQGSVVSFLRTLSCENGALTSGSNFVAPYVAIFINDPSKEAIYEE